MIGEAGMLSKRLIELFILRHTFILVGWAYATKLTLFCNDDDINLPTKVED